MGDVSPFPTGENGSALRSSGVYRPERRHPYLLPPSRFDFSPCDCSMTGTRDSTTTTRNKWRIRASALPTEEGKWPPPDPRRVAYACLDSKDTLCRNVLIYGHCRYEDQGCAFNHENRSSNSLSE
ncbi:hypothetical protein F4819DRAFT_248768 [Hypoxylon fuscum]|nr:hypothetical protein F4819DRAFT_248768 [Hypoxylon fuscum]